MGFWLALPLVAATWFYCHRSPQRLLKVVAETLQPWLIAMAMVAAIFVAARLWLPRAEWSWLVLFEKVASRCDIIYEKLSLDSLILNCILLVVLFTLNILLPASKTWTIGLQKAMSYGKQVAVVIAVVAGFTFFGSGQGSLLLEATAEEKYERLKDESTAVAELPLAARMAQNTQVEAQNVSEFLDSVYAGVSIDLKSPQRVDDDYSPLSREETLVGQRVAELVSSFAEGPHSIQVAHVIGSLIPRSVLDRRLTDDEVKDTKDKFTTALDKFVDKGADFSSHPLSQILAAAGLPSLLQSIVKDLYAAELTHMSKNITEPLANVLFHTAGVAAEDAIANVSNVAGEAVFDGKSMPAGIVSPTYEGRLAEKQRAKELRQNVKDAVERAKR